MSGVSQGIPGFGPVVVGTDGSRTAAEGVLWAAGEAAAREQPLTVVHAIGVEQAGYLAYDRSRSILDAAERVLDESVARVSQRYPGVAVTTG
ncbi:universal stress protein [Streptomyces sp. NBC_01429]|uniref:universal stress protein n=1 Tax=Streptomyces sp. NBC_01429 TaxID=2903862 RepID=UPI002E28548A|nr:universal stress protein [Streptomyces sp. NBC_01429]